MPWRRATHGDCHPLRRCQAARHVQRAASLHNHLLWHQSRRTAWRGGAVRRRAAPPGEAVRCAAAPHRLSELCAVCGAGRAAARRLVAADGGESDGRRSRCSVGVRGRQGRREAVWAGPLAGGAVRSIACSSDGRRWASPAAARRRPRRISSKKKYLERPEGKCAVTRRCGTV